MSTFEQDIELWEVIHAHEALRTQLNGLHRDLLARAEMHDNKNYHGRNIFEDGQFLAYEQSAWLLGKLIHVTYPAKAPTDEQKQEKK